MGFTHMAHVQQEYPDRGWFAYQIDGTRSGPWRTQEAAELASAGLFSKATKADTATYRKEKKAAARKKQFKEI